MSARRPWTVVAPPPTWRGERHVVYRAKRNLYVNLTHRCETACLFCHRLSDPTVGRANIYLPADREPSADEAVEAVRAALAAAAAAEVVFCGYGEPTLRWDILLEVARRLRAEGLAGRGVRPGSPPLRLNTNGHGDLIQKRPIAAEAAGLLDSASVSLNAPDPETYERICPNAFGRAAHPAICAFIRACLAAGIDVQATAVEYPGVDIESTRRLALSLGASFEARPCDDVVEGFPQNNVI